MDTIIENELVKELANKHGRSRESLLPILQDALIGLLLIVGGVLAVVVLLVVVP